MCFVTFVDHVASVAIVYIQWQLRFYMMISSKIHPWQKPEGSTCVNRIRLDLIKSRSQHGQGLLTVYIKFHPLCEENYKENWPSLRGCHTLNEFETTNILNL